MRLAPQTPDEIAHELATNVGAPFRVYLTEAVITVPRTPYTDSPPPTETIPCESFLAVLEDVDIVDGGLELRAEFHLPESEWERVGPAAHWHHEDADLRNPRFPPRRTLELRASRESAFHDGEDDHTFEHLSPISSDSPLRTEWSMGDCSQEPPAPLSRPMLFVSPVRTSDAEDTSEVERIEVGEIAAVGVLEDLEEWPREPEIEPRPIDLSLHRPSVDYATLDPLPQDPAVLDAVFSINRHAKRLSTEADRAYRTDRGTEARMYAVRKNALYATKTVAIHRLVRSDPSAVSAVKHRHDGRTLWCFSVGSHSFHQPTEAVDSDLLHAVGIDDPDAVGATSIEFEPSATTEDYSLTLDEALEVLTNHGLNANEYLLTTQVEDREWGYQLSTEFECLR